MMMMKKNIKEDISVIMVFMKGVIKKIYPLDNDDYLF